MTSSRLNQSSLLDFEESIAGKSGNPWINEGNEKTVWAFITAIAITMGLFTYGTLLHSAQLELASVAGAKMANACYYAAIVAPLAAFAWWVTIIVVVKMTPRKTPTTALLGVTTVWIILVLVRGLSHFILIEGEWEVVWANRILVLVGQQMTEQMTQAPGSPQCINPENCYGINQNFRLWWVLYLLFGIIGASYGTNREHPARFLVPFTLVSLFVMLIAWNPTEVNYHREVPLTNLSISMVFAYLMYAASYLYCRGAEEYQINRVKTYISVAAVATFFFSLLIMNPPQIVKDFAEYLGGTSAQSMRPEIISGEVVPNTLDKLAGDGIEASQWGGLFVNLVVATAGCVLGFGIGVVLAFGRQSDQPLFSVPSVALIELVRSGPLICWLYFAVFMMPDMMDPFYNAEDIIRMLLMFGLFGGCYIAEVLRGGLQAVDSGQKEAAAALGLSPFQTKMQVELPNAVRTTLPSIVSVFIGLWKDTTLLFIVNILDFFKLAKDLPNTDLRFLGDFLEPLYVTAVVFWVFAFYLSRVSMKIEKNLGLVREGGGEAA